MRSFMVEVTKCIECPYLDILSDTCDAEGTQMEINPATDGGLPSNCPVWLERVENAPKSTSKSSSPNPNKGIKNILRWKQ